MNEPKDMFITDGKIDEDKLAKHVEQLLPHLPWALQPLGVALEKMVRKLEKKGQQS